MWQNVWAAMIRLDTRHLPRQVCCCVAVAPRCALRSRVQEAGEGTPENGNGLATDRQLVWPRQHTNGRAETHTGQFRIRWATSNEAIPGKGRFKLILHSSVSGRWVADAADVTGVSSGVSYQAEEPRQFFLIVESAGEDWNVSVQEGEMGEVD